MRCPETFSHHCKWDKKVMLMTLEEAKTHRLAKEGLADESASDLKDLALTMRWPQTIHSGRQS